MGRLDVSDYAEVIESGRIGLIENIERTKVKLSFRDKSVIYEEYAEYNDFELKPVEINMVKNSQLKDVVRGELTLKELSGGSNYVNDIIELDSPKYRITVEDLYAGYIKLSDKSLEEIYSWCYIVIQFFDEMWSGKRKKNLSFENGMIEYIYNEIDYLYYKFIENDPDDSEFEKGILEDIGEVKDEIKEYLDSDGDVVPVLVLYSFVTNYDCDNINKQDEKTQQMFKKCLDRLCDKEFSDAIQKRGYCYYCGTKEYPNDWVKARESFIKYYNMTGDASAANTLGYIYYYGRCNNGVPEYEEAFKYFSIGHAFGIYESTYKLADMFTHGYAVVKNFETAYRLYYSVYSDNLEHFRRGVFDCKFADIALRMGNCYRDGIDVLECLEEAYCFYLEADYAIRKRIEKYNFYGDTVVYNGIQKALAEAKEKYKNHKNKKVFRHFPEWVKWMTIEDRKCKLKITELEDRKLSIKATILKKYYENYEVNTLVTIPELGYSELRKDITLITEPGSIFEFVDGKNEIIFEYVEYDYGRNTTKFYLDDKVVGKIITRSYTFDYEKPKKKKPSGKKRHFVSVVFSSQGRMYDYLCDDATIQEGDHVVVNGYDGEIVVEVVSVFDKYESELGLPIDRYKKIIRKAK